MSILAIPSPNTDRSLLAIADLRAAAGVADGSQDAQLLALGRYVSAVITKTCNVQAAPGVPPTLRLETVVQTDSFDACQDNIVMRRRPVIAIESVVENGVTLTADTDYRLDGPLLQRRSNGWKAWWLSSCDIAITYSAGWQTVPDDLAFAARKFFGEEWRHGDRDRLLKRKVSQGISEYEWWVDPTKDSVIPADVMTILRDGDYINPLVG